MRRHTLIFIILMSLSSLVLAQSDTKTNWQRNSANSGEYNCDVFEKVFAALAEGDQQAIIDLSHESVARFDNDTEWDLLQYIGASVLATNLNDTGSDISYNGIFDSAKSVCQADTSTTDAKDGDTFTVKVKGNINARACAGTDCDIVQTVNDGTLLTVIGKEEDWYEVQTESGTVFVAAWLTTRGPDAIIPGNEQYRDPRTGCIVLFDHKRGDMDMNILLSGEKYDDLFVDLYRPNETRPLKVAGQIEKTFTDTGDPYIHQYYSWNVGWPSGTYQIEITLGDKTSRLGWELVERGDYNIFVYCD